MFANMDYRLKVGLVIVMAFVATYAANYTVVKHSLEDEAMALLESKARAVTQEAENARRKGNVRAVF